MVRLFVKEDCVQCDWTRNLLVKYGVEFVEEDILLDDNLAFVKGLGFMSAPVVVAGDQSWAGFQPDLIKGLA